MDFHGFFVTGTDTGIGKTYISRLLVDSFSTFHPTTYMKPVQTGCFEGPDGELHSPDLDFILEGRCTMTAHKADHLPYCFKNACSPHLAASIESLEPISINRITKAFTTVAQSGMPVIVEGAGGVMAPLNDREYLIDLIVALQLPVVLVSSPHLGTLNHTLLSMYALNSKNIPLAGIVMNNVHNLQHDTIYTDNISFIQKHCSPRPLLKMGFGAVQEKELNDFCKQLIQ